MSRRFLNIILFIFSSITAAHSFCETDVSNNRLDNIEQELVKSGHTLNTILGRIDSQDKAFQQSTKEQLKQLSENLKELDSGLKVLEKELDGVKQANSTILSIASFIIALAAFIGGGGVIFSVWEAKSAQEKMNRALMDFKTKESEIIASLNKKDREQLVQYDQFERITRLTHMLYHENYDQEVFFSDLSQLAQAPTAMMSTLVERISGDHREKFESDILDLANRIKDALSRGVT